MLVQKVVLTNEQIAIVAQNRALARWGSGRSTAVPNVDRKWCPGEDSNLHALASAST
jgi:site-specific DNA recombinase